MRFEIDIDRDVVVEVAPSAIVTAFANIIKNAYESFAHCARTDAPVAIRCSARREDAWIDVGISDNGMGFSKEETAALLPSTPGRRNKTKRHSTGYGIPNAMRKIEAHGGTIEFESQEGIGTTVYVRLPSLLMEVRP